MTQFAQDYLLFVLVSALGSLLLVTANSRLNGLLLVGRRLTLLVGGLLVVGAFSWFFASEPRNVPDTGPGLDGNEQAVLFAVGAGAALVLLLILSALRNWSMMPTNPAEGIEALRTSNYLRLIGSQLRYFLRDRNYIRIANRELQDLRLIGRHLPYYLRDRNYLRILARESRDQWKP